MNFDYCDWDEPRPISKQEKKPCKIAKPLPEKHHYRPSAINCTLAPEKPLSKPVLSDGFLCCAPISAKPNESQQYAALRMNNEIDQLKTDWLSFEYINYGPAGRSFAPIGNRLVKECKSPTQMLKDAETRDKHRAIARFNTYLLEKGQAASIVKPELDVRYMTPDAMPYTAGFQGNGAIDFNTGEIRNPFEIGSGRSAVVRLLHRDWSDQWRIRVESTASPSTPPPQQAGERFTMALTAKSVSKIIDAGAYMAAARGGFKSFFTFTFDTKSRKRLAAGEITIGGEVSRFMDAANAMYKRGWSCRNKVLKTAMVGDVEFKCIGANSRVAGNDGSLDYIWVAENPKNENGDDNPHVHVLFAWEIEPYLFPDWAARIEKIWGHGTAHIERIHNPESAGSYILKAIGYLTKSGNYKSSDQGQITGNRYGMSKTVRAPDWEVIESFHAEHMASIIGEVNSKLEARERPTRRLIKKTGEQLKKAIRDLSVLKRVDEEKAAKVKKRIKAMEQRIKTNAAFISERKRKVWARDFQLTITGKETFSKFLNWSVGVRNWSARLRSGEYINTAPVRQAFSRVRQRFEDNQAWWCGVLSSSINKTIEQWQLLLYQLGEVPPEQLERMDFNEYENWMGNVAHGS